MMIMHRLRPGWGAVLLLLGALCAGSPRAAAQAAPGSPSLEAQALAAPIIIRGTVTEVTAVAPANPFANYEAAVRVEETLKGVVPDTLPVRYPGPPVAQSPLRSTPVIAQSVYTLTSGEQRVFLLQGSYPYRLAAPFQSILPIDTLPTLWAALAAAPLTLRLTVDTTTVANGLPLQVTVQLTNTGSTPRTLQLPENLVEACRFWSWSLDRQRRMPPIKPPAPPFIPARYTAVTLQSGETKSFTRLLDSAPFSRSMGDQHVYLAVSLYYLPGGTALPQCLSAPPVAMVVVG